MKSSLTKVAALSTLLGLAAATYPVAAHHSTTMFDREKTLPLVGTVKELHWTNPHVAIFIDNSAGQGAAPGLWVIELTSPGNLVRSGWTRTIVKPGDKVTADIHPLRDGTKGGALRKITLTDTGQSYTYNIRDQERPNLEQDYGK
ncbi:MAG: hypothetical protein JWN13_4830 [Betaproteobacteria bacterium]|jgi:hypothetical protein|nr:hypothetical protein [Betaproteobacteria bacterium]MEA3156154.1 hypothetical protein [Betaproteobacteria bacterium]